ncbi:hypothetical protein Tco_1580969 [Tanacetum coccineum]
MMETMGQYMSKTRGNYGSGIVRPKISDKTHFKLKGQFLKELRENTFSSSELEDANEHIEKVLEIVDLFYNRGDSRSNNASSFPHVLNWSRKSLAQERTIRLDYKLRNPKNKILDLKGVISTKIAADAKVAIQEMAEYSRKWHNGTSSKTRRPHYTKDYPLKEERKTVEEAYYIQFGAAGPGFYQRNNRNS